MQLTSLVQSIGALLIILAILVILLVLSFRNKARKAQKEEKKINVPIKPEVDFQTLRKVINNKKSSKEELQNAVDLILKYYGTMHEKLGIRAHPDSDVYMITLFQLCRHPNADKKIVLSLNNGLEKQNPTYLKEINDALMKGLNSRGV